MNRLYLKVSQRDSDDIVFEFIDLPDEIYLKIKGIMLEDANIFTWFKFPEGTFYKEFELTSLLNPLDNDLIRDYSEGCSLIENQKYTDDYAIDVEEVLDTIMKIMDVETDNSIMVGYNELNNRFSYGVGDRWITLGNDNKVEVVEQPKIYFNIDKIKNFQSPKDINKGDLVFTGDEAGVIRFKRVNSGWIMDEYIFEAISVFTGEIYRICLYSDDKVEIISQSKYIENYEGDKKLENKEEKAKLNYHRFKEKYYNSIPKRIGIEQLFSAQFLIGEYTGEDPSVERYFQTTSNSVYFAMHGLIQHLIDINTPYSMVNNLIELNKRYKKETIRWVSEVQKEFKNKPFDNSLYGEGGNNRFKDEVEVYDLKYLQELIYDKLNDKVHPVILKMFLGPKVKVKSKFSDKYMDIYHRNKKSYLTLTVNSEDGYLEILQINNVPKKVMNKVLSTVPDIQYKDFCVPNKEIRIKLDGKSYVVNKVISKGGDFENYMPFKDYNVDNVKIRV